MMRIRACVSFWPLVAFVFIAQTGFAQVSPSDSTHEVKAVVASAIRVLVEAADNYPSHAECFSCHHQTIPLAALKLCEKNKSLNLEAILGKPPSKVANDIADFTRKSLLASQADLDSGKPIDGRAETLGYGMWVFALADRPQDTIAQSLRRNAMQTQSTDGSWDYHSFRPPASSSKAMATALTLFGISQVDRLSTPNITTAPDFAVNSAKVRTWLNEATLEPSMEEQFGAYWCRLLTAPGQRLKETAIQEIVDKLRERQRSDGGWAQEPNMESDAYATGQALVMLAELIHPSHRERNPLHQTAVEEKWIQSEEFYKKGIGFLLANQKQLGAWHVVTRAKPVQPFFDNGDPFGKDQFISIMATGWATMALASYLDPTTSPLSLNGN